MSKIGTEVLAQTQDDMGEPELSKQAFEAMLGGDPVAALNGIMREAGFEVKYEPSAYEVEEAHREAWLWELTKYEDIDLARELEDRGYTVRRDA